jgi:hypothetical protein
MNDEAKKAGLDLDGPHTALIVRGYDDQLGECANVHEKLSQAGIDVYESSGTANIKESYGIILYLNQEDCERAMVDLKM